MSRDLASIDIKYEQRHQEVGSTRLPDCFANRMLDNGTSRLCAIHPVLFLNEGSKKAITKQSPDLDKCERRERNFGSRVSVSQKYRKFIRVLNIRTTANRLGVTEDGRYATCAR
jgi:hypothetical protein